MSYCAHPLTKSWINMPFDVKSNMETKFGHILECRDCGHRFASAMPTSAEMPDNYRLDAYYTHGSSHIRDVTPSILDRVLTRLAWTFEGRSQPVAEFVAARGRPGRMLDIGAGAGELLRAFQHLGYTVEGVEPDADAGVHASAGELRVLVGTAEELPPEVASQRYDVVAMTHVLEHCVSPETALSNVHGVLAEGGLFYCEVPNCGSTYFTRYAQISEMLDVPRHLQFFTQQSLVSLGEASGFSVEAFRHTGFTRHFSPSWCAWENSIRDRLIARGADCDIPRRTYAGSLALWAETALAPADKKYDCLGVLFRRH